MVRPEAKLIGSVSTEAAIPSRVVSRSSNAELKDCIYYYTGKVLLFVNKEQKSRAISSDVKPAEPSMQHTSVFLALGRFSPRTLNRRGWVEVYNNT